MKKITLVLASLLFFVSVPVFAAHRHHTRLQQPSSYVTPYATPYSSPYATPYATPATAPVSTSTLVLGAFNANIGSVSVTFLAWKDPAPLCTAGKTELLYWENPNVSYDQIISGSQDAIIRNFGLEVCPGSMLAIFHEMNLNESPWYGPAAKEIQAFQHIHNLIGNKVTWTWVVNNVSIPSASYASFYPGSSYVDAVGIDAFDYSNETYSQATTAAINEAKQFGKPVWLTSVGAHGANQLPFVTQMMALAPTEGLSGIIYFDYNADLPFALSPASLAAFHL